MSKYTPPLMTKKLHKEVVSMLHPDRVAHDDPMFKKYERCLQEFNAVEFTFPHEDA
jgi:hypothetical protein